MQSAANPPQNPPAPDAAHPASLHALRHFALFVGNPRSGTTLVRSLVDAHPEALLGVEVDVAKYLHEDFETVLGRIAENRARFARNPVWTNYNYQVPVPTTSAGVEIRVIGDKRAAITADAIARDPAVLQRLGEWCPLPIRWIHCVRNPYDCIASKLASRLAEGRPTARLAETYLRHERSAQAAAESAGAEHFHRLHLEDLVAEPERELRALQSFLELAPAPGWLEACRALIWKEPHRRRRAAPWNPKLLAELAAVIEEFPHLHRYRATRGELMR